MCIPLMKPNDLFHETRDHLLPALPFLQSPLPIPPKQLPEHPLFHHLSSECYQSIVLLYCPHCLQYLHLFCLDPDFLRLLHPGYVVLLFQPLIKLVSLTSLSRFLSTFLELLCINNMAFFGFVSAPLTLSPTCLSFISCL
ncbi:hypothetical protein PAPYR_11877 [Paratrimastix pyriformis]|uniref:Uncharacterized protein n=1 Tax=Paratrimastix pyriformis TaxID=342808 RepID=A0ABQ8U2V1_9EUKA|nr:hypothetical protein PAPYR_11877 [Paratrimastix pyriformis]